VLLAYLDTDELEEYFRTVKLIPHTPNTIISKKKFRAHLAEVKVNGYAIDDVELMDDVRCVSAPIFDNNAKACAAISISGPVFRMTKRKMEKEYVSAIKITARIISQKLGFTGNP
jgi:DNA-binding IclR family transcriptional regulator